MLFPEMRHSSAPRSRGENGEVGDLGGEWSSLLPARSAEALVGIESGKPPISSSSTDRGGGGGMEEGARVKEGGGGGEVGVPPHLQ